MIVDFYKKESLVWFFFLAPFFSWLVFGLICRSVEARIFLRLIFIKHDIQNWFMDVFLPLFFPLIFASFFLLDRQVFNRQNCHNGSCCHKYRKKNQLCIRAILYLFGIRVVFRLLFRFPIKSDSSENVMVITGGNAGVGYASAEHFVTHPDVRMVILGCRSESKCKNAAKSLSEKGRTAGVIVDYALMDLLSLDSMENFAKSVQDKLNEHEKRTKKEANLVLINNAGFVSSEGATYQIPNVDVFIGGMHLSHFYLSELLQNVTKRVVVVSSILHERCASHRCDIHDDLTDGINFESMTFLPYSRAKMFNALHARQLFLDRKIPVVAVDIAAVATDLVFYYKAAAVGSVRSPEIGALPIVAAALESWEADLVPKEGEKSGRCIGQLMEHHGCFNDPLWGEFDLVSRAIELRDWSCEMLEDRLRKHGKECQYK